MSLKIKTTTKPAPKPKTATKTAAKSAASLAVTIAKLKIEATAAANAVKTTPGHGVAGRHPTRALLDALSGNKDPGMFGRMFPMLPPLSVADAKLQALANAMVDANAGDPSGNNPNIRPASPISASSSITTSRSISPPSATRRTIRSASRTSARRASISTACTGLAPTAARTSMRAIPRPATSTGRSS
jgi:hypothetical protein